MPSRAIATSRTTGGPWLLAIDLGSSQIKALVVDSRGWEAGRAAAPWSPVTPPELAPYGREYVPQTALRLVRDAVRRCLRQAGVTPSRIAAVAVTSQREGIALLDGDGHELYLGPNTDIRAFLEGQAIDEEHRQEVYGATGHAPSFLFAPAKLRWFQRNQAAVFDRIRWVLPLDSWLTFRLTGEVAVAQASAAEVGLLDTASGAWATGLLARLGLPAGILPPLAPSGQVVGRTGKVAAELGLAEGTPVVTAGPDTQCGLLGMGALESGEVGVVAGWSAPVQMVVSHHLLDSAGRTWTGRHLLPQRWVVESTASEAGGALRWLVETVGRQGGNGYAAMERGAARTPPGAAGVLAFLGPRLGDMRDIGPRWGGLLFPVPLSAGPVGAGQLYRAAMENFGCAIRANWEQLREITGEPASPVRFGGGMARSPTLSRVLADVMGTQVQRFSGQEISALGAAMCAATGAALYRGLAEAARGMAAQPRHIAPDPLRGLEYRDHYARWRAVAAHLEAMGELL